MAAYTYIAYGYHRSTSRDRSIIQLNIRKHMTFCTHTSIKLNLAPVSVKLLGFDPENP